ncbi:hypothetical protein GCM10009416_16560 [Craurococcus roseus]|uniref:DUF4214 domain-containing protein n=1 Tax=Craurococcus roseus TaxID=77585 RepID=A0ABP3Q2W3_9PROT
MKAPRRAPPEAGDLLAGDDHDFVVNLYLALLRRWPDDAGYRDFLGMVAGRPERRIDALRRMAASEEAHRDGATPPVIPPGAVVPADPRRALAVALDLRTSWLRDQVAELREAVELLGGAGGPELSALAAELIEARDAALRSEIGALRREVAELRRRLEGRGDAGGPPWPDTGPPAATDPLPRRLADYVGDLLAIAEARFEARLRALEARALQAPAAGRSAG